MIQIELIPEDSQLAELVNSLELISYKAMPNTYRAFKMASSVLMYTWKSYAMGSPIPGGSRLKNPTGIYAKSIKIQTLSPYNKVIYSDSPVAKYLEDGTKEYDMKKTHPFGQKSRVTKEGDAYLIIPFRHGTPKSLTSNKIPEEVYNRIRTAIKNEEIILSSVKKGRRKTEPNYKGELIPRASYNWGSRIVDMPIPELEGMVIMDVSTKKSIRSEYLTFRVISVNSPAFKWIQRARPGKHITKYVVLNTEEIIKEIIQNGIKKDLGL